MINGNLEPVLCPAIGNPQSERQASGTQADTEAISMHDWEDQVYMYVLSQLYSARRYKDFRRGEQH